MREAPGKKHRAGIKGLERLSRGASFPVVRGDSLAERILDEARTQPCEGGNQLDALTLYVK